MVFSLHRSLRKRNKRVKLLILNLNLNLRSFDILKMKNGPWLIKNLKRNLDLADQNRDERSPNVSASWIKSLIVFYAEDQSVRGIVKMFITQYISIIITATKSTKGKADTKQQVILARGLIYSGLLGIHQAQGK